MEEKENNTIRQEIYERNKTFFEKMGKKDAEPDANLEDQFDYYEITENFRRHLEYNVRCNACKAVMIPLGMIKPRNTAMLVVYICESCKDVKLYNTTSKERWNITITDVMDKDIFPIWLLIEEEQKEALEKYNADALLALYWKELGDQMSYKLKYSHILNFHALIGACLKEQVFTYKGQKQDLRVHPLIVRPSGSGKALSYELAEEMAKKAKLMWATRSSLTVAGLIGTIVLRKGEPIPIYGDAAEYDIIGFTEAQTLSKSSSQFGTMTEMLNQILDPKGEIFKRLATGVIAYKTHVSLLLSTYPSELMYENLQTGFLQRCSIFYEDLSLSHYIEIVRWMIENIGTKETKEMQEAKRVIVWRLKAIKQKQFNFDFSNVKERLTQVPAKFENVLRGYPEIELLKTFTTRYLNLLLKFACHHAALDLRDKLTEKDIEYGEKLCIVALKAACEFLVKYYTPDKDYLRLERQLTKFKEKDKEVKFNVLLQNLRPWKIGDLLRHLEPFEIRGDITVDKKRHCVIFR